MSESEKTTVSAILIRGELTAEAEAKGVYYAEDHFHSECAKEALGRYETVSMFRYATLDAADPNHCDVCGLAIS